MQMKYLSLALAAALATTLTACGGSDNGNYNKPTLTPVTNPDVKPGDDNKKPDDENKKPDDGNKKPDDKPEDENKKPDDGNKKPDAGEKVEDPTNNIGDAANPGNPSKEDIVVAQNYVRGEGTKFDRTNNPDPKNDGNPTVLGYNDLENKLMTNIVLAHVPKPDGSTLTLVAGENPNQAGNTILRDRDFSLTVDQLEGAYSKDQIRVKDWSQFKVQYQNLQDLKKALVEAQKKKDTTAEALLKKAIAELEANIKTAGAEVKAADYVSLEQNFSDTLINAGYSLQQIQSDKHGTGKIGSTLAIHERVVSTGPVTVKQYMKENNIAVGDMQKVFKQVNGYEKGTGKNVNETDILVLNVSNGGFATDGKLIKVAEPTAFESNNYFIQPYTDYKIYPVYSVDDKEMVGNINFGDPQLFTQGGVPNDYAHKSGLVIVETSGKPKQLANGFKIRGQEDDVIVVGPDDKVRVVHENGAGGTNGSDNHTRIFGALYRQGDIPAIRATGTKDADGADIFVGNDEYNMALNEVLHSGPGTLNNEDDYVHTSQDLSKVTGAKTKWNTKTGKEEYVFSKLYTVGNMTNSSADFNKNSYLLTKAMVEEAIADGNKGNGRTGNIKTGDNGLILQPAKIHLNHVQYGRVTVNADDPALKNLERAARISDFSVFDTTNKFAYQNGLTKASQDKKNATIDYYFARGLQPTKGVQMPKEGKINYLGHALMYGIDNSYHGINDGSNSNAPVNRPHNAIGNFVSAQLDMGTKDVTGKIYNIWTRDSSQIQTGVVEDTLVTFNGKINDVADRKDLTNSVIGTATRAYVKDDAPAAFKGGFFGPGAQEFAGNINSIAGDKFGDSKWGGVFGAKRIDTYTLPINNGVEVKQ